MYTATATLLRIDTTSRDLNVICVAGIADTPVPSPGSSLVSYLAMLIGPSELEARGGAFDCAPGFLGSFSFLAARQQNVLRDSADCGISVVCPECLKARRIDASHPCQTVETPAWLMATQLSIHCARTLNLLAI